MDLQTTTYRGRNLTLLRAAAGLVDVAGRPVRVLEVGPGLAVRYLGRTTESRFRPVFKGIETVLRRLPLPDSWFENYETGEIIDVFAPQPIDLTIFDVNPRSLSVIAANLAPMSVATVTADIARPGIVAANGLAEAFDLVVALSTVSRVGEGDRRQAAKNLIAAAAPGGLIVENTYDLERLGSVDPTAYSSIYRRRLRLGGSSAA